MNLKQREAEILATTEADREEDNGNPIVEAERCPNRFRVMSLFFSDSDGVTITEELDSDEQGQFIRVEYFNEEGEEEVTEGALYDWAIEYYENR